jgi:ribonuclease P protein subunit POP4
MMVPITNQNLIRHELIGLQVSVIYSSNPTYVGIKGKVIDEMKNMLIIHDGVKKRWIQKDTSIYCFTLPDKTSVIVEGEEILGKPVERTKKKVNKRQNR